MERIELINTHRVTLHSAAATLPALSGAAAGGDISTWWIKGRANARRRGPRTAVILIDGAGSLNLSDAELWGYDDVTPMWRFVGFLNSDLVIPLTATNGWASKVVDVGLWSRLGVKGTLSASTVNVFAVPAETWS